MEVEDENGSLLFVLSTLQEWVARLVHYHAAQVCMLHTHTHTHTQNIYT
jgi:hypothetical protein